MDIFDVVVVGSGHAGCEAACVAARMGRTVALVSFSAGNVGMMSCNPAIGGIGKGHLVREVDALGGLIGRAADAAAIHYRMLNRSKGAAVWGPRVQADRRAFARAMQELVGGSGVTLITGEVAGLQHQNGVIAGVSLGDGRTISARAVILATGTFLRATMHMGGSRTEGGRTRERAATHLGQELADLGLRLGRLKTGTPPRLDGRTIDWARLQRQESDADEWLMSPQSAGRALPQLHCAITRTIASTHDIIRSNLDQSPVYSGSIEGRGPRYCPSIEDKVVRFGDRDGHQIFLEPEGLNDNLVYPNGISTALPAEVQNEFVRSIPGLEATEIAEPGYAVEYDYVDPRQLGSDLQLRELPGLFLAGQINGTTGYEEAAAQGLVAGVGASRYCTSEAPMTFERYDSYVGVLVDDLTTQGVSEPYRMLTARAEYRLRLRADNAVSRLGPLALKLGCLTETQQTGTEERLSAKEAVAAGATTTDTELLAEVEEDRRYAPYVERQAAEISALRAQAAHIIPAQLDYASIAGLSNEMKERLMATRPVSLGQAQRIPGITPAALAALAVQMKRHAEPA
ncbi:tRNA uridine-5-carboxymethylaminomethyl(34) synthesis enzyme MnmG [Sphingomonas sp. ID0503]|uniref:tRNA uridine-5-carboxymethylaminomethyl(34) synthesis enzyme MnmG n=1 Tax=Sphingomonas sp. ID0503 TaxID=3399691 RepID=UPI003AFB7DE9